MIAERPVAVPHGTEYPRRLVNARKPKALVEDVLAVEEHALWMLQFGIVAQLVGKKEADQIVHVETSCVVLTTAITKCLGSVVPVVDDVLLRDRQEGIVLFEVRIVYLGADAIGIRAPDGLIGICVEFKHGCTRFITDRDRVVVEAYLLRQVIAATIATVDVQLDRHDMACASTSRESRGLLLKRVAQHGTRLLVAQQYPMPAAGHTKRALLLGELEMIRVLAAC